MSNAQGLLYAASAIKRAIQWIDNEYGDENKMPSFAYEARQEMDHALSLLDTSVPNWYEGNVQIEGVGGSITVKASLKESENWNGFACPYFAKEEADKVALFIGMRYDHKKDAYIHKDENTGEDDVYYGVQVYGEKRYPIGAYSWCWTEEEE